MLHRAANNAYSWWWASHIRTKQSKWLDNNLQEMDEKVQYMLKLIDEDGDSFAKRAESYYRKRPELIGFVEEFYRAYRALAERYDHISGELQNANHTIATVFPEKVQFAMDEEDDTGSPKVSGRQVHTSKIPKDLPEVPKITIPDFLRNVKKEKSSPAKPPKRMQSKKTSTVTTTNSHMSKDEAIEEIDKLQKGILALQTEKEFVKSSYENRLGKYWEIEKAITDMQEKVCGLQDEFNVGTLIEDHEARTLMASIALKSCQETLVQLQEKQERSNEEAKLEYERIKNAREKIVVLKGEFLQGQTDQIPSEGPPLKLEEEVQNVQQEITDAESVREKIREHFEMNSSSNLTVPEMAEKIDELVTKVISLETAVSSQTALIDRLRSETDGLQEHLRSLEEDKVALLQDSNKLNKKLRELEGELNTVQELNRNVANQNNNLQTHFTEAHCNLDHLSEKLKSVKPLDEEIDSTGPSKEEVDMLVNVEPRKLHEEPEEMVILSEDAPNEKEEVDVLVHVESHREHEEPEETITISEDAPKEKDEATGVTEVRVVQDPGLHVNDQAEAPTLHVNEKEEAPSLHLSDQAEAPNLQVKMKDEALSLHVSDQAEAPYVQVKMKDEAPNMHVSDQVEALSGHVNGQAEVLSGHVNDQAEPTAELNSGIMDADIFEMNLELMQQDDVGKQDSSQKDDKVLDSEPQEGFNDEEKDEPNWQELYLSGLEERERILLAEYTSILRKYKETRKQLSELQIKNHDSQFEAMVQLRELKNAIAIKDEEIKSLRQKLKFLQESDNSQQEKAHENGIPQQEKAHENGIPQQEKAHVSENSQQEKVHDMLEGGFSFQTCSSKTLNLEDSRASSLQDRNAEERGSLVSSTADRATDIIPTNVEEDDEVRVPIGENHTVSALEEKFRRDIDELLEQNLEFWLRFSGLFHQIQTFQTSIEDLQGEYMKLKENQNQEDSASSKHGSSLQSNARPIYKHLREIQTDLTVWLEKNMLLKDELKYRLASLRSIYDEITRSSKTGSGTEVEFTSYQAAKFQGEVLNMQQENNKVADELQAGLEHVKGLQVDIDKALVQMNDELKLSGSKGHHHNVIHSLSRTRIPLRSFLFGAKKRQKPFFACMSPALQKQYSDLQGHVPR